MVPILAAPRSVNQILLFGPPAWAMLNGWAFEFGGLNSMTTPTGFNELTAVRSAPLAT